MAGKGGKPKFKVDRVQLSIGYRRERDFPGLGAPFVSWVSRLVTRDMSPNTRAGYVSDLAVLGECMLRVLGLPPPPELRDRRARDEAVEADAWVRGLRQAGIRPHSFVKARAALCLVAPEDMTVATVEETLALDAAGRSPASRARARIALNQFCRYLVRTVEIDVNPLDQLETDRSRRRLPKPLEPSAVRRLLVTIAQPDPRARHPWPGRDLALAAVLSATGVRLAEVLTANVGSVVDLDGPAPLLRVLGKGSKERVVELHEEAAALLRRYLAERQAAHGRVRPDDPLFVRADGTRFTPAALRRLVDSWYRRAGVQPPPGAVVHAFRHTFATEAVRGGAPLRDLQEVMGHASLETTAGYLKVLGTAGAAVVRSHASRDLLRDVLPESESPG
ncbi:MAG TPA: tyrosine-type recombinase/integrase [Acidimicrobiales bacterium]|nr:tyrosine-type recombinase/integrase [Acidimicrobiales bacterium]